MCIKFVAVERWISSPLSDPESYVHNLSNNKLAEKLNDRFENKQTKFKTFKNISTKQSYYQRLNPFCYLSTVYYSNMIADVTTQVIARSDYQ